MIKLFGHPASTYTRKVLCTLHEIEAPFELRFVDLNGGEHTQAAHLARQPFGRVPTIDDQGFTLYESRAIIRYLNDQYGGRLVPPDVRGRAAMDQWIDVGYSYFSAAALKPILHHVFGFPQDEPTLEAASAMIEQTLDVLEARLGAGPFLAGEQFSLADIVYLPDLDYLMATPLQAAVSSRGNVASWWARSSERPSWRKATGR
ncbi:glutathione S-transferase family protein [Sphingosinicella sp. CPCC 101087]|uniref:glutathione S-transferase family protein n=1 Tax=Sphingosinicella sp. CPCC 101087 TaxID=2497754 RepID=UPI00101C1787|nr:glutathione S-transferase N-terminal domain-containing protein [Sphingosinicella sp. CPCC 101087]